uniref:Putative ovule protein n=1 Tax=Solanum chacoense TaxID=4108 RepID=A0A0V0HE04_SOLCH
MRSKRFIKNHRRVALEYSRIFLMSCYWQQVHCLHLGNLLPNVHTDGIYNTHHHHHHHCSSLKLPYCQNHLHMPGSDHSSCLDSLKHYDLFHHNYYSSYTCL